MNGKKWNLKYVQGIIVSLTSKYIISFLFSLSLHEMPGLEHEVSNSQVLHDATERLEGCR
jgi:hypothetical protein